MQRIGVGLRVHCHRFNAKFLAGPDDSNSNLASIGNQYFMKHDYVTPFSSTVVIFRARCFMILNGSSMIHCSLPSCNVSTETLMNYSVSTMNNASPYSTACAFTLQTLRI